MIFELTDNFWRRVDKTDSCWLWRGAVSDGYGLFSRRFGAKVVTGRAHRLAYTSLRGPVPNGMLLRHRCNVPLCVNPDHLEIGTFQDNSDDKVRAGRARNRHTGPLRESSVPVVAFAWCAGGAA